jgi:trimethylamine--corrinoid protein Co-methyltransferase
VEKALQHTPSGVHLFDRGGNPAMDLEGENVYFGTGSDTPNVIDLETGERRKTVLKDVVDVSRVVDSLSEISFLMCSGIANDVSSEITDIYHFEAMVNNSSKPIVFTAWSLDNLKTIVGMAELVAGGEEALRSRPFITLYTEPISPLILQADSAQKLMFMAEKELPVVFAPSVTTGATGPVTLAGGLVQGNAEILAGFVLAHLVREVTPLIYGGSGEPLDMSVSVMSYAAPESMMMVAGYTDMAKHYNLPLFGYAGCSDSNLYDQQASLESSLWILISTLTGGNLVHDVGYINNGLTTSFEQLVVSDEVIGAVRRIAGGIQVNEETLALDLIHEVGPGGEYLTSTHTLNHFRENWFPSLICRATHENWSDNGALDLGTRANKRAREILENHRPEPLPEDIQTRLREIVKSVDL